MVFAKIWKGMCKLIIVLIVCFLVSCGSGSEKQEQVQIKVVRDTVYVEKSEEVVLNLEYYIVERLPEWFLETRTLDGIVLMNEYEVDDRLNPLYLEADFNGDDRLDIAVPIRHKKSDKEGLAIIHGETGDIHIIGAGIQIKNGLSDDMSIIDIWKINRKEKNEVGVEENTGTGEKGELILNAPSLQVEKSEVGGGQIYWNGKEYAYFHQTC